MDEYRVKGIVISSIDYKDKDKLITLFTLEFGKISAVLRGVKNKNAKLKFASQLFCFADFILVKRGDYFTVTSAEQIESFYEITANYEAFLAGQVCLEIVNTVLQPNMIAESFFVDILKTLKLLTQDDVQVPVVLLHAFLNVLQVSGYGLNFGNCSECKMPLKQEIYFDFDLANITCKQCAGLHSYLFKPRAYNTLKLLNGANFDSLHSIKVLNKDAVELLHVMHKNFEIQFGRKLKTMTSFFAEM